MVAGVIALAGAGARAESCPGMTLAEPTDEYGHKVLGAEGEYKAILIRLPRQGLDGGALEPFVYTYRLPEGRVFEDVALRCADLDGLGPREIVVVETGVSEGAQLAIYGADHGDGGMLTGLRKIAATPPIGTPMRWLAPAAIGDLDDDGQAEIAIVVMPHLEGRLEIWGFAPGGLTREATGTGFSNHRIGDDHTVGGWRDCGDGPEIVLPDFEWQRMMAVRVAGDGLEARALPGPVGRAMLARHIACEVGE